VAGEVRANHNVLSAPVDDHLFRRLAENIPALCWIADASGYISWYNPLWYQYTGTTPAEMEGWGWQSVHEPRNLAAVLEQWSGAIASAQPFEMIRGADGVFRPFLTRINPAFDFHGNLTHWFGVNTDISLQVKAEDAVVKTEARFRLIADSMPQMVWSAQACGVYDYFNARWYEFTGAPIGSTDGDGWRNLLHPDDRVAVHAAWAQALDSGSPYRLEHRLQHHSGAYRWVLASSDFPAPYGLRSPSSLQRHERPPRRGWTRISRKCFAGFRNCPRRRSIYRPKKRVSQQTGAGH
jgi:PAS domain S-box-containing protein